MNSVKHGLRGNFRLIFGEDPQRFSEFAEKVHAELKPQGAIEEALVNQLVNASWSLERVEALMSRFLDREERLAERPIYEIFSAIKILAYRSDHYLGYMREIADKGFVDDLQRVLKANCPSVDERSDPLANNVLLVGEKLYDSMRLLMEELARRLASKDSRSSDASIDVREIDSDESAACAFVRNEKHIALLLKYRSQYERTVEKSLHELQRLQAQRQGQIVPLPAVVDINLHSDGGQNPEK